MSLATFAIITTLKTSSVSGNQPSVDGRQYYYIQNLRNLGSRQPFLALSLAIVMFSMAGVPPLAGFFSKYYILSNAILTGHLVLALAGIVGSSIAAFYYIKLIQLMFFNTQSNELVPAVTYNIS